MYLDRHQAAAVDVESCGVSENAIGRTMADNDSPPGRVDFISKHSKFNLLQGRLLHITIFISNIKVNV